MNKEQLIDKPTIRNNSIDALKLFCAFLVVVIHFDDTPIYRFTEPLTRIAVPCFFAISGYFLYGEDYISIRNRTSRHIKKVFVLLLVCSLLYAIKNKLAYGYYFAWFDFVSIFMFNDNPTALHLWYLSAYLYVLLIYWCLVPAMYHDWLKKLFPYLTLLIIGAIFLGKYSFVVNSVYPLIYSRNFLFTGLPCFVIGIMVARYQSKLVNIKNLLWLIIGLLLVNIIESEVLQMFDVGVVGDIYITTIPLTVLFLSLSLSSYLPNNIFSEWGRKYSLYIYVYHVVIGNIFVKLLSSAPKIVSDYFSYCLPLIVFFTTVTIIILFVKIRSYLIQKL